MKGIEVVKGLAVVSLPGIVNWDGFSLLAWTWLTVSFPLPLQSNSVLSDRFGSTCNLHIVVTLFPMDFLNIAVGNPIGAQTNIPQHSQLE